ncbi:uncharacterized protein LOC112526915 [Cynara cardunculus var. scolymus]|uniref:uncharacterized protein LOC112526915 n=1 Tax=Cynara cardunculus var. scolymus TaxID=59895 RepID=UPI000D62E2D4|nr:uncharacterized protein LOC112526915 [Cynara cardunculus var. scolymus]
MGDNPPPREATVNITDDKNRGIRDYATPEFGQLASGIGRPEMTATSFEPKPIMFQMISAMGQFGGLFSEDPHSHLKSFIEMTDHFKIPGVTQEVLRLTLFLYTLEDRARAWLNSQPPNSILTWNDLVKKFLKKYFPPTRNVKIRNEIMTFRQEEHEAVSDAWERFKDHLRKCHHHGIPHCIQLETFYNGLSSAPKIILDATAGGAFTAKIYEGYDILERISNSNTEWSNPRAVVSKSASRIHQLDAIASLNAQIVTSTNLVKNNLNLNGEKSQVQSVMSNSSMTESCVFCGESHSYEFCPRNPVSVNYVGNHTRNSPFSPTYNPNWRNHSNFSWAENLGLQAPGQLKSKTDLQIPRDFIKVVITCKGNGSLESLLKGFINQTNATLRNFETQLGQFAADLKNRPQGTLPSDTETPKEHVKAVTLRSDKNLGDSNAAKETPSKPICQENISHSFDTSKFSVLFPTVEVTQNPVSVPEIADLPSSSTTQSPPDTAYSGQKLPTPQQKKIGPTDLDMRDLPFPGRMKAKNMDVQFKKLLDIFKQLHINIPLVEALEQMPSYVKFLKDILNKKRRLSEFENVSLTKECSALLTCKIPPKLKDPGSFIIPCSIGGKEVGHALCDIGGSINLMPLFIFNQLGIREARPTIVTLQLADSSLTYPKGRPFLAMGRTLIDVQKGELTMRVNDQQVTFNVFKTLKFNEKIEDCSSIYSVGEDLDLSLIDCVHSGDTVGTI